MLHQLFYDCLRYLVLFIVGDAIKAGENVVYEMKYISNCFCMVMRQVDFTPFKADRRA